MLKFKLSYFYIKRCERVIFLLLKDTFRYKSYEQIAAVSSGQVYQFSKQNVNQMVEYLEAAIQAHKVHLLTTFNENGSPSTWKMPFDSLLQEVTISIAGPGRDLRVYDPYGREYTRATVHINNEESYVIVIHKPQL